MRSLLPVILTLAASGCMTSRLYYDRTASHNGPYHSGKSVPSVRAILSERHEDGEFRNGRAATLELLATAFLLVQNPDYYQKSTIGGRCIRGSDETIALQTPCISVTYVLIDGAGKELERLFSDSGSFQFFAEKNRPYFVAVLDGSFHRQGTVGPVGMGDEIVIRLKGGDTSLGHLKTSSD